MRPANSPRSVLFLGSRGSAGEWCFFEASDAGCRVGTTPREEFSPTKYWPDFWTWLLEEVRWLEGLFDENGHPIAQDNPYCERPSMTSGLATGLPDNANLTVSLGYMALTLFRKDALPDAQMGYSLDPDGNDLTGPERGDWRANWLVIGYEDLCGDPIFIDAGSPGFPVYTAAQGIGHWRPELISSSFENLLAILDKVKALSLGRENPVLLKQNPISSVQAERVLAEIERDNAGVEMEFWRMWLCGTES
jgi:hypothetical protein